jgi:hypothetical protein
MKTEESIRAQKLIQETGMDQSTAIRWALTFAANVLEHAWINGYEERGKVPRMKVSYRKLPGRQ